MNNSWAMNGSTYGANDRTVDLGVRDALATAAGGTPLLIVFSAGNRGPNAGTVTKNPKNAILVGNSLNFRPGERAPADDIRGIATGSSRGPAADGRLFPTVIAPGTDIISAYSPVGLQPGPYTDTGGNVHPAHTAMSGTSMASPHVAGAAAILIDWWRQTRNGATPSPALVKTLLLASTESVPASLVIGIEARVGSESSRATTSAGAGCLWRTRCCRRRPATAARRSSSTSGTRSPRPARSS